MPYKYYQGRTGIVYNVTKRALGVQVNKVVRGRTEVKRLNVRIEHVRQSRCRLDFHARVKKIEAIKAAAKKAGIKAPIEQLKRFPGAPELAKVVKAACASGGPVMIAPQSFEDLAQ